MKNDRDRWESRYREGEKHEDRPDSLLEAHGHLLTGGRALDLACGYGANGLFVARAGYAVDAVDISLTALSVLQAQARHERLNIRCAVADLDDFVLPRCRYDLVLVFYFFSPALIGHIRDCLKPGGLLFYATYNHRHTTTKPGFNPVYLVPRGGLGRLFHGLTIILDNPDARDDRGVSELIARKP